MLHVDILHHLQSHQSAHLAVQMTVAESTQVLLVQYPQQELQEHVFPTTTVTIPVPAILAAGVGAVIRMPSAVTYQMDQMFGMYIPV